VSKPLNDFPSVELDPDRPYDRIRELYLYEEPALLASIHRGDRREATRIINLLLVHIYSAGEEHSELLKSLLLELVVMMSRAAVEAGAPQAELLGLRFQNLTELAGIADDERLAAWLRDSVLRIFDAVERCQRFEVPLLVTRVLKCLRERAGEPLTREQVARSVAVSPGHLAHILKARTGRTFTELLREARVERACSLLAETDLPIAAIAADCGFCDQSYMSNVFQNLKKTTPKNYRTTFRDKRGLQPQDPKIQKNPR